jgi:hypothetical protein
MKHYGKPPPTQAERMSALRSIIIMRDNLALSDQDIAGLCRSYGVARDTLLDMVDAEKFRRVMR